MPLQDILPSELGFGGAPLGNMFRSIPEREAIATVEAAWADGIRYYDNAPFYGAGMSEPDAGEGHPPHRLPVVRHQRAAERALDDPPLLRERPDRRRPLEVEAEAVVVAQIRRRLRHSPPGEVVRRPDDLAPRDPHLLGDEVGRLEAPYPKGDVGSIENSTWLGPGASRDLATREFPTDTGDR